MLRTILTRILAATTLLIATAFVVALNLFAAHFRDFAHYSRQVFDQKLVLARLLTDPLELSLQSYILFVLGLLFAIYAAHKGYTATDKLPGYESVHRRCAQRRADYAYLKTDIHGAIDHVKKVDVDALADYPLATADQIATLRKRLSQLLTVAGHHQSLDARDCSAARIAIDNFRTLNKNIRTDGVTPAYFTTAVSFDHLLQRIDKHAIEPVRCELAAGKSWDDIMMRLKVSPATIHFAHLIQLIDKANAVHTKHTLELYRHRGPLLERIKAATDNTDKIMLAIEKSHVGDKALPELSELRTLIDPTQRPALPAPNGAHPTASTTTTRAAP